jgi:hypothetical protein
MQAGAPAARGQLWGVDLVTLKRVVVGAGTIIGDPCASLVRVRGMRTVFWYRGVLPFRAGDQISIIYQTFEVHAISQSWILAVDRLDLRSLCMRFKRHENCLTTYQHL